MNVLRSAHLIVIFISLLPFFPFPHTHTHTHVLHIQSDVDKDDDCDDDDVIEVKVKCTFFASILSCFLNSSKDISFTCHFYVSYGNKGMYYNWYALKKVLSFGCILCLLL